MVMRGDTVLSDNNRIIFSSKRNQSDLLMWKDVQKMANVVGVYGSEVCALLIFLKSACD